MEAYKYFIQAESYEIDALLTEMDDVDLDERFAPDEANVDVPSDVVDEFTDYCDENNIKYELV